MGCDIHFVIEKKHKNKWVGVYTTSWEFVPVQESFDPATKKYIPTKNPFPLLEGRDYAFFAKLAGVRGEGPEPLGLPADCSDLSKLCLDEEDPDLHSHSCCTLDEFVSKKIEACNEIPRSVARKLLDEAPAWADWFDVNNSEDIPNMRVVFAFDN